MDLPRLHQVREQLAPYIEATPLIPWYPFPHSRLYLKCEHLQATHSFKVRGAFHSLLSLSPSARAKGVITRSRGNFAQALAYAGSLLGVPTTVILPPNVSPAKKEGVERYKGRIIFQEGGARQEQQRVESIAKQEELTVLFPFNSLAMIEAAGTLALEIYEQRPSLRFLFAQVGGGALMAGLSAGLKLTNPNIHTVAVEPIGANDYSLSRKQGRRVFLDKIETIADGLRAPEVGDIPWPFLQKYVDEAVTVEDKEIREAMRILYHQMGMVIEPSGATSLAYAMNWCKTHPTEEAVCILTGANIDRATFFSSIDG